MATACERVEVWQEKHYTKLTGKVVLQSDETKGVPGAGILVRTQAAGAAPFVWEGVTDADGAFSVEVEWLKFADYFLLVVHPDRDGAPNGGADFDLEIPAWEKTGEKSLGSIAITLKP